MWAACCLAFFGFLRCNEFTIPSQRNYDPAGHFSYSDIAVDDCDNPSLVVIYIKKSKTDPFHRGTSITLGATRHEICPVKALMLYLARRGSQAGPPFHLQKPTILYTTGFPITPHEAVTGSEFGPFLSQYTQLQNWCSHISRGCRTNRITN